MGMLGTIQNRFENVSTAAKLVVVGATFDIVGSGTAATSWTICDLQHKGSHEQ